MKKLRQGMHKLLSGDTKEAENSRAVGRAERKRLLKLSETDHEGNLSGAHSVKVGEDGEEFDPETTDDVLASEEEIVMSCMLTQLEMEGSLAEDYDSISQATKQQSSDLQTSIVKFDDKEKHVSISKFFFFILSIVFNY